MAEIDDFLSDIKTDKPKSQDVESFLSDIKKDNPTDASVDDFLSDIPGAEVPRETKNVESKGVTKQLISPEAKTKLGKIIAKGLDIWNMSQKSLETEAEKLIVKSVDRVQKSQDYLGAIQNKIAGLDFMKVLMTPMGKYYASMGAKMPTPSMVLEKAAPKLFDLPADWDDPLKFQYPDWIIKFLKSVGGEPNAAISKFSQMVFLDTLAFNGMDAILGRIMPAINSVKEIPEIKAAVSQTLSDINKMTPEGLKLYNRELAMSSKPGDILAESPIMPLPLEENTSIVSGVKYSTFDGEKNIAQPIKKASKADELVARKMSSIENEAPHTSIQKDITIEDIMPPPGEVDVHWTPLMRVKQLASTVASPFHYARPVYDQVMLHKQMVEDLHRTGISFISNYIGKFTETQLNALGAVKDKFPGHELVIKNWNAIFGKQSDEALQALEAYRKGWDYWKKTLGLSEDQAIKEYLPHIIKYYQNRDLPVPAELNLAIKNQKKFLKERKGAIPYSLNIEDLYKIYNGWAARYTATEKYRKPIAETLTKMRELNPEYFNMAHAYALNYFGEFYKIPIWRYIKKITGTVGKTLSDALIGNNFASALANIIQGPYFGLSSLGHHWFKGLQLALKATFGADEQALRWQKIWMNSGLEESANTLYYKEASSIADFAIQKMFGHKVMQKIDDASYVGMKITEVVNKKPVYLGAYNKAEQIVNKVMRDGPGKHRVWEQWLQKNGIDISKNIDTELFKFAHYETVKAMQDYSRAGQNLLNILPGADAFMRVANFPLRAGENVLMNAMTAGKYMAKALFSKKDPIMLRTALLMPETGATLRFGLLTTVGSLLADKMGLSLDKVIGVSNFVVTSSPLMSVTSQIIKGFQAMEEHDPQWVKKNLKSLATIMGFKLTAPAFQLARFIETANANKNNHSGKWTIYAGDHRDQHSDIIDQVDPLWFAFSILSPVQFNSMADYRKWIKENARKQRIISNLTKQIEKEDANYNTKKSAEIKTRQDKFIAEKQKEEENLLQKHPNVEIRSKRR